VHSYPAIRLFHGADEASWTRYKGPRKASSIVPFVKRASLPAVSTVNINNITKLLDIDLLALLAYLKEDDSSTRSCFSRVAEIFAGQFVFGVTHDAGLAAKENISFPSIVAHKTDVGDKDVLTLDAVSKRLDMEKFVLEASRPLIDELTMRNERNYMSVRGYAPTSPLS
jgi:protein disulfide-isomerase A1